MDIKTIVIPEKFNPRNVIDFLREWVKFANDQSLRIDVSQNLFCGVGGIAMLASCLSYRKENGWVTSLLVNPDNEVFRYLQRIDFFHVLGVETQEKFSRHPAEGRFVPLQSITTEMEAGELANAIIHCIRVQVPDIPPSLLNYSRFILDELGVNIVQHAEAGQTGFGLGQVYHQIGILEYAYADYGIGILQSFAKNLEFATRIEDDDAAIRLALQDNISSSTNARRNMGAGLYEFERICQRMNGELWILSGNACLYRKYTKRICIVDKSVTTSKYHGTWICFRAPLQQA